MNEMNALILQELRTMNEKIDILMADKSFREGEQKAKEKTAKVIVSIIAGIISLFVSAMFEFIKRKIT